MLPWSAEVAVEGLAGDVECPGDVRDGVDQFAVGVFWSYICRATMSCRAVSWVCVPPVLPRDLAASSPSRVPSPMRSASIFIQGADDVEQEPAGGGVCPV